MVLQRLKHETRPYHEQIELVMDLPARLHANAAYCTVLARLYGVYAPVEQALRNVADLSSVLDDIHGRWKTERLVRDLTALGMSSNQVRALPQCTELPALPDVAHALGCLYVFEGATLGGQLIVRQVVDSLGVSTEHGGAFFSGYGPATGPMWQHFGAALTAYAITPERETAMVAAAQELFLIFRRWLAEER
ncbi:MAG: biliverdin-producing heme oxygenase [Oscillochloris sp.]|nr:biliverdin-producing heme oxygenase [Oscillochloris sp.]